MPNNTGLSHTLEVSAATAGLGEVRRFVEDVAQQAGLDAERVFDVKVAVSEACANAIEHAGHDNDRLKISSDSCDGRLTFTVADAGNFRPPSLPRENRQNLGLGLPLMVALMDEVRFAKAPQGGTIVSLSVVL